MRKESSVCQPYGGAVGLGSLLDYSLALESRPPAALHVADHEPVVASHVEEHSGRVGAAVAGAALVPVANASLDVLWRRLLSSRKRSSGTAENSASIICVNTRELRGERFSFSEPVQIAERADAKVGSQASSFKLA
jgi:hypothetical protein